MDHFRIFRVFAIVLVERFRARVVAVDPKPMHRAAMRDLQFADDGNVVFRLTRDHARAATGADVKIDIHSPLLRCFQWRMRIERENIFDRLVRAAAFLDELVVVLVALGRRFTHNAAAFDAPMVLRASELVLLSDFRDAHVLDVLPVGDGEMRIARGAQ